MPHLAKWALVALVGSAAWLSGPGCKKYDGPPAADVATASRADAGAASDAAADGDVAPAEVELKGAFGEQVAAFAKDFNLKLLACAEDYLTKMDMAQMENGYLPVNANQMDKVCREGIESYKRLTDLGFIGRHAQLDALFEHAALFSDHYYRLSFKLRQLGSRDRWKIAKAIKEHRETALQHINEARQLAATLAKWGPNELPEDETPTETRVDAATYRARLAEVRDRLVAEWKRAVERYDQYAFRPGDLQESIYRFSFTFYTRWTSKWFELTEKRLLALTTGDAVADEAGRKKANELLAAARPVLAAIDAGAKHYVGDYFTSAKLEKAVEIEKKLQEALKKFLKSAKNFNP